MSAKDVAKLFKEHTAELRKAAAASNVREFHEQVARAAEHLNEAFLNGHRVFVAGNGGSAAEAEHFSDEMLGRYRSDRRPYPATALTTDGAAITCIGNDYGYEEVFSRQLEALGQEGDVFIGLSTSGTSKNIIKAVKVAREHGMTVIALTGPVGNLKDLADYPIISPSEKASIMQEFHLHAIHLICEAFEDPSIIPGGFYEK